MARTDVKFAYAEYSALPETGPRYQLIEGELVMSPSPNLRHQTVVARIFVALFNFVEPRRLGIVRASPLDVILSQEDVLHPDIVYVSNERRMILMTEGLRGGPDLCVEVLSDRTQAIDRGMKRILYARHGVTEYWIVDPETNTVEVYRLQENPSVSARTLTSSDILATPLLPDFSLTLDGVFMP